MKEPSSIIIIFITVLFNFLFSQEEFIYNQNCDLDHIQIYSQLKIDKIVKTKPKFFYNSKIDTEIISLKLTPFYSTVWLKWDTSLVQDNVTGFAIFRKQIHDSSFKLIRKMGIIDNYTDYNLQQSTLYQYKIGILKKDTLNAFSITKETETFQDNFKLSKHTNFFILVVHYLESEYYTPKDFNASKITFEGAKEFFFRNSRAKLSMQFLYLDFNKIAPRRNDGFPDTVVINEDLKRAGIDLSDYDVVVWVGISGNYGGGNSSAGKIKGEIHVNYLPDYPFFLNSIYIHEMHHVFDGIYKWYGGGPNYPKSLIAMAHPQFYYKYQQGLPEYPDSIPAAWGNDWYAMTIRLFEDYFPPGDTLIPYIECIDSDEDGIPDKDSRVPIDEFRMNSHPNLIDSDFDYLNDLDEMFAGIYRGSDPTNVDTDSDGIRDGNDLYPFSRFPEKILKFTPIIDGNIEKGYTLLYNYFYYLGGLRLPSDTTVFIYSSWDENYIYFAGVIEADIFNRVMDINLFLDGSPDNGPYEGGDTYHLKITKDNPHFLLYLRPKGGFDVFGNYSDYIPLSDSLFYIRKDTTGRFIFEIAVPNRLTDGMSLTGEIKSEIGLSLYKKIGIHFYFRPPMYSATLFEGSRFQTVVLAEDSLNQSPQITSNPDTTAIVGKKYYYKILATDPDNDKLVFSPVVLPSWLDLTWDGILSGIPTATDVGDTTVSIKVEDGSGGNSFQTWEIVVKDSVITKISRKMVNKVGHFIVRQNYPNPFNHITHIRFGLPKAADVLLEVYNTLGQKIATLAKARFSAGYHEVTFEAGDLPSGIYLLYFKADDYTQTRKMILMK